MVTGIWFVAIPYCNKARFARWCHLCALIFHTLQALWVLAPSNFVLHVHLVVLLVLMLPYLYILSSKVSLALSVETLVGA